MYLIFDCETTGLPSKTFKPRIVQLAAILADEAGEVIATLNSLIKPDGWTIPDEVIAIHGKTLEMCEENGRPMPEVLAEFNEMKARAIVRVAHNLGFDKQMLAIEAEFYGIPHNSSGLESFCTMHKNTKICKIDPSPAMIEKGNLNFKVPSLQEAYSHYFGEPFDGAHDAFADAMACKDVFFKMREMELAA